MDITESQRALLREVCTQAWNLVIQRRDDLLYAMHGEVHGGMEHCQQTVYQQDTAGVNKGCWWGRNVLKD
jgi:hypothetical protein